jgi:hypothetical protein
MARGRASSAAPRRGGRTAVYGALGVLAKLIDVVVAVVAIVIAAGILLVVLKANPANEIVKAVHDVARWLVGPFADVFKLSDRKLMVAVNWGLALVVYVIVGRLIAALLRRPRP